MEQTLNQKTQAGSGIPTSRLMLWIGIISIIMVFAGLTSAYMVRRADGNWLMVRLPLMFWFSTGLILISSFTMRMASKAAKLASPDKVKTALWLTLVLGFAFVACQLIAWRMLVVEQQVFFVGNPAGSFLYVISGLHIAHLLGGMIFLLATLRGVSVRGLAEPILDRIRLCATYWHFLDALWVYLFLFLLLAR